MSLFSHITLKSLVQGTETILCFHKMKQTKISNQIKVFAQPRLSFTWTTRDRGILLHDAELFSFIWQKKQVCLESPCYKEENTTFFSNVKQEKTEHQHAP